MVLDAEAALLVKKPYLECSDEVFLRHSLVSSNTPQDRIEGSYPQALVSRDNEALATGRVRYQNDVATDLTRPRVTPVVA